MHARNSGHHVTILSSDKDLAQLIEENDTLWDFAKNNRFNPKKIKERFGVRPDQIADLLALAGDKVDNIPGEPGIGMRTAARLLNKFESIENLLQNIPAIADMKIRGAKRIKELVDAHQDDILMCKKLTQIECNAEMTQGSYNLQRNQCDHSDLHELFDELGFGNLRRARWQQLLAT